MLNKIKAPKHRKHWRKLTVHPDLHKHIMGSQLLSPMAEEQGEIPGRPDSDDAPSGLSGVGM